jgi:hypothetical protein
MCYHKLWVHPHNICTCYHKLWVHPQAYFLYCCCREGPNRVRAVKKQYAKSCSCSKKTANMPNRVRAVKKHHHQNLNLYRTRNSANVRRLWCKYSLLCLLMNLLKVCFDLFKCTSNYTGTSRFNVIFMRVIFIFLLCFWWNFCQPFASLRFKCVSGKLLTKREICQYVMYCHVTSLIIINHYWATMLVNRYL